MKPSLNIAVAATCTLLGLASLSASDKEPLPATPPPDSLVTIERLAVERCRGHNSLTGRMRLHKEFTAPQGEVTTEAIGEYLHERQGEKIMFRVDLKNVVTTRAGGREAKVEQQILTISDGMFSYTLAETDGKIVSASKSVAQPAQTVLADVNFFQTLRAKFALKVMPDEKIDGHDVWVIEARPHAPVPGAAARSLHYILKDSGIRLRSTDHDATGRRIQFAGLSDLKFDEPIDPKRFIFTAPKGVQIVDMTGS